MLTRTKEEEQIEGDGILYGDEDLHPAGDNKENLLNGTENGESSSSAHVNVNDMGPMSIELLVGKEGISKQDIKKLREAGINSIESLCYTPMKSLVLIKGISEQKATKLLAIASGLFPMGFTTAKSIMYREVS